MEVLGYVESNHDASFGVSWDSIYYTIFDLYRNEIEKAEEVANVS